MAKMSSGRHSTSKAYKKSPYKKSPYKKSLLFTVSIVMIISTLLGLAFLVYDNTFHSKTRTYEFSIVDRFGELDSSLQSSVKDIFTVTSGINLSMDNLSISFAEQLPNRQAAVFNSTIADFFSFAQNQINHNLPAPILNLSSFSISTNMTLLVSPYDLVYTHPKGYGESNVSILSLDPDKFNVTGFDIRIITTANVSNCEESFSPSPVDSSLNISVSVMDHDFLNNMEGCIKYFEYPYTFINKSLTKQASTGYIKFKNTSNDLLFTIYYTNGELNIQKEPDVDDSLINITVKLVRINDNPIEVKTYDKIINIRYDDYSKLSSVTILS